MTKEGYQPIKKETIKIIPPNTGSHVHMKKEGYTWEDMDRSYWEGFDTAKGKMEKHIEELEKENAELKEQLKCAEHNCKVKQEFNDNQFNAIMKLREEITKLTDELYLSGLSEKQIAIIEQIQDLVEKDKKHHYKAEVINGRPTGKAILVSDNLEYAKSIIEDLLNNSDEYAKQRAREFLEENLK